MIKKFIIRKSPKFKEYKLKPVKPKVKQFTTEASMLRKEAAEKIARRAEYTSLEKGMLKIRSVADKMITAGTNKNMKRKIDKAGIQAFKTARAKGMRTLRKASDKLGVGIRQTGSAPKGSFRSKGVQSDFEAKQLGFAPREIGEEMKAFYAGQRPAAQVKKFRKTISKVYKMPKGQLRANLKSTYRARIKSELKQAKEDRNIFRSSTIQQEFKTKSGKRTYKTIRSPEIKYDNFLKRYYRTKPI
tara:strand:+ start:38 stop:769 length:732 start_codon:yes stop_codon:yes gene_type:complete